MTRERLALLWRAGVVITVLSVGLSLLGWLRLWPVDWPPFAEVGALGGLAVVAIVVVVGSRPRPFPTPTPPSRRDERERDEATRQLLRGKPFTGSGPDTGDIERSRRVLWSIAMQTCWWPVGAASWAFQAQIEGMRLPVALAIGSVLLLGGSAGALISVRARRRRLDLFEDTEMTNDNVVH